MSFQQTRRSFGGRTTTARRPFGGGNRRAPIKRGPGKQYIHPSKFIQAAKTVEVEEYKPTHQFEDFELHPSIKRNIIIKGFKTPSKIQDIAIPHGLAGKDVVGIANTGTGKTTAFALPIIHKILNNNASKAIVIAPTRELANQIEEEFRSFAKGSGIRCALLIGGSSMGQQIGELRGNPNVVIGTPGRMKDHLERGTLRLHDFDTVVLDEVDRMVDMGFINDITFLLGQIAEKRQSLFFSATMDYKIEKLVQQFLTDPVMISVKTGDTSDSVEQNVIRHGRSDKLDKLHDVLIGEHVLKTIVFDETKRSVERLSDELLSRGFKADALHGGKSQGQRERALRRFKNNEINVLVATDVAARGIDVTDITHVINYATPNSYDDYVHRVGRAGRAGRKGYALTFIDE